MDNQQQDEEDLTPQRGEVPQEEPQAQHEKPRRGGSWLFMMLTFIIAVVALVLVIISWGQNYYNNSKDQPSNNQATVKALEQKVSGFQSQIDNFKSTTSEQQKQISSARYAVEKIIEEVNQNQDAWQLTDAEHLLQIANYTLNFTHDVPTTISLLQTADSRLQGLADPDVYPVRKLIAQEVTQLTVLPKLDVPGIYMRLEALRKVVMQLPLMKNEFKKDSNNYLQKKNPATKGSFTHGVWTALSKVVVVRHRNAKIEPLLSTDDHMIVVQNFYLLFSQAEWALIQRQQAIYESSLNQIHAMLIMYFDHVPRKVKQINDEITALEKINIKPQLPSIGQSLKAIHALVQTRGEKLLQGQAPKASSDSKTVKAQAKSKEAQTK